MSVFCIICLVSLFSCIKFFSGISFRVCFYDERLCVGDTVIANYRCILEDLVNLSEKVSFISEQSFSNFRYWVQIRAFISPFFFAVHQLLHWAQITVVPSWLIIRLNVCQGLWRMNYTWCLDGSVSILWWLAMIFMFCLAVNAWNIKYFV